MSDDRTTYCFRPGRYFKVDAQTVGEELTRIRQEAGELTPAKVLQVAKAAHHPLHKCFTWDDKKAAGEHRKWEARQLITSVRVVDDSEDQDDKEQRQSPAFIHVTDNDGPRYEDMQTVVSRPDLYASAIGEALRALRSAERAVEHLKDAAGQTEHRDQLSRIEIALTTVLAARDAIRGIQ